MFGVVGQKREPKPSSHFPDPTQLGLLRNRDIPQSQISNLEPEVAARQEDDDGDGPSHRRSMNRGGRATCSRNGDARNCDHDYGVQKEEEDGQQIALDRAQPDTDPEPSAEVIVQSQVYAGIPSLSFRMQRPEIRTMVDPICEWLVSSPTADSAKPESHCIVRIASRTMPTPDEEVGLVDGSA